MGKVQKKTKHIRDFKLRRTKLVAKNKIRHVSIYNTRSKRTRFEELPMEVLVKIFSNLSQTDLFKNVRAVCPKFYIAASSQSLWRKIQVGPEIPTAQLQRWLEIAPKLRVLELNSRLDAAVILKKVVKHNKNLEDIRVHHCWGSTRQMNLPSDALCKLLVRCPYLHSISLTGSRFVSCKFFKLLALCEHLHKKKRLDGTRRVTTVSFSGCASLKQLRVFLNARKLTKSSRLSFLSVESQAGLLPEFAFSHEIIAETDEDIERILQSLELLN